MNIALFNDSFPPTIDGVANAVKNYADCLTKDGDKVCVITPEYPNVIDNYPFEVYRYTSLNFKGKMPYRVGNPFLPITVLELSRKDFDILHVHCPFSSAVLAHEIKLSKKNRRIPTVFTYHTKFDIDIDNFVQNKRFNSISKKFILTNINYSDEVWCVSKGATESLRKIGYQGDVRIMQNGTDFEKGKADSYTVHEIKRMYNIDNKIPTFLFCGRMMWYKNIKLILDGLKKLRDDGIKFRALFVGDGPDRPAIEQYTHSLGFSDDMITFTGAIYDREKIRGFFSISDLLLFPSTYDTSGLVVKEAAACYCPSILVRGSCAAEGVTHMKNGILIEETPDSFAKEISDVLKQENKLCNLGIDASESVYYSWKDAVNDAKTQYERISEEFKSKNNIID